MGYDLQIVPELQLSNILLFLSLALANIPPRLLVPFFQIFELKISLNTFRNCRAHFILQPSQKQLYESRAFATVKPLLCWILKTPKKYVSCLNSCKRVCNVSGDIQIVLRTWFAFLFQLYLTVYQQVHLYLQLLFERMFKATQCHKPCHR